MSAMDQAQQPARARPDGQLFFGLALIGFGALLLADRLPSVELESGWPFLVIGFGIWKLIDPPPSGRVLRSRRPGAWLLYVGAWGLANEFRLFGLYYDRSWPLMVVGAGVMLVWRSFEGPDPVRAKER